MSKFFSKKAAKNVEPAHEIPTYLHQKMRFFYYYGETSLFFFSLKHITSLTKFCFGEEICLETVLILKTKNAVYTRYSGNKQGISKKTDINRIKADFSGEKMYSGKENSGSIDIARLSKEKWGANGIINRHVHIMWNVTITTKVKKNGYLALSFSGNKTTHENTFHAVRNHVSDWILHLGGVRAPKGSGVLIKLIKTLINTISIPNILLGASLYGIHEIFRDKNDITTIYRMTRKVYRDPIIKSTFW